MSQLVANPFLVQVVTIVAIYSIWRVYQSWLREREQKLRQRVTYMLWVAAHHAD